MREVFPEDITCTAIWFSSTIAIICKGVHFWGGEGGGGANMCKNFITFAKIYMYVVCRVLFSTVVKLVSCT